MAVQEEAPVSTPRHLGPHEAEFQKRIGDVALVDTRDNTPEWGYEEGPKKYYTDASYPIYEPDTVLVTVPEHLQAHHHEAVDSDGQKASVIRSVTNAIRENVHPDTSPETDEGAIDWSGTASRLLNEAKQDADRDQLDGSKLVGALICSQFGPQGESRIEFLKQVYDSGLAKDMHDATKKSELAIVVDTLGDDPNNLNIAFHRVAGFAGAFGADKKVADKYLGIMSGEQAVGKPPGRRVVQRSLAQQYAEGAVDEATLDEAIEASTNAPKQSKDLLDVHKVERFALQEYFIRAQMELLFPDNDFTNSPFSKSLAEFREVSSDVAFSRIFPKQVASEEERVGSPLSDYEERNAITLLANDLMNLENQCIQVIHHLSTPAVEAFNIPDDQMDDPSKLTPPQRASYRFMQLAKSQREGNAIASFVNFERGTSSLILDTSDNIWDLAIDGAAAPGVGRSVIYSLLIEARRLAEEGDNISADELYQAAQQNRDMLLSIAGAHILDFASMEDEVFKEHSKIQQFHEKHPHGGFKLQRNEAGKLEFTTETPLSQLKNQGEEYIGVTMGCPVLRITHEGAKELSAEEKAMVGSKNYIDHVLAAIFTEAHQRGLFNVSKWSDDALDINIAAIKAARRVVGPTPGYAKPTSPDYLS